jgi:hypothetical protein
MSFKDLPTDEQVAYTDDLWGVDGFEMSELFSNDVPHVKGERVVKPTGLPPSDWSLA